MSSPSPTRISFAASELFVLDVWRDAEGSPVLPPHTSLRCAPPCPAPACVVSSATHVAACDGTRVWYALCGSSDGPRWVTREYGAAVQSVSLGAAHAAVVAGSTLHVHGLLPCVAGDEDWQVLALPASATDGVSSACFVAGATSLLYFGTQGGMVGVLELRDRGCRALGIACMRPATPNAAVAITGVFPSPSGTCAVAVDVAGRAWAACPLDGSSSSDAMAVPVDPRPEDTSLDESLALADAPSAGSTHALWDVDDDGVVAISCNDRVVTCLCRRPPGGGGILLQPLGHLQLLENGNVAVDPTYTQLPHSSHAPLLLVGGAILTLPSSPASCAQALPPLLQATVLASHAALGASMLAVEGKADAPYGVAASAHCASLREAFLQLLALGRLTQAHRLSVALGDEPSCWLALGGAAMASLQLDIARAAYAALRDEGMVQALDALVGCEDVDALIGGVHALYGESDAAQSCLEACGDPSRALELRRAARQWPEALDIARRLVPDRMTQLLLEAAADAEAAGGFEAALAWYDAAALTLMAPVRDPLVVGPERTAAAGGTARCSFQLGDTPRGMAALTEACSFTKDGEGEPCALLLACSAILEARGQAACAADLCMRAHAWDQAAALLLSVHDAVRAAALVERVSEGSPLLLLLAQAAEAAGDFVSAARGYERGAHTDALVRVLCCDALADLPRAAALAATTRSPAAALCVASLLRRTGDARGAVECLLAAGCRDEAFTAAADTGEMGVYLAALRGGGAPAAEECARVCRFFETRGQLREAAEVCASAGEAERALRLLLRAGTLPDLERAVDFVAGARDEALKSILVHHLQAAGASEGEAPADGEGGQPAGLPVGATAHVLLLRLHLAMGDPLAAGAGAAAAAGALCAAGAHAEAHTLLFRATRELVERGERCGGQLHTALLTLHSHALLLRLSRAGDHAGAASLAARLARPGCADRLLPRALVQVLTAAVVESLAAGRRRAAHAFACRLLAPAHASHIEDKFRRRVEDIVRRPPPASEPDAAELASACPFCECAVPIYELACGGCGADIPACLATGQHMTLAGCSACPHCTFPALQASLVAQLAAGGGGGECPMCGERVEPSAVTLARDPRAFLRKWAARGE